MKYEKTKEDKTRRVYIEKQTRLDAIDDFVNRHAHNSYTFLLQVFIYLRERKQVMGFYILLTGVFLSGFLADRSPFYSLLTLVVSFLVSAAIQPRKETE